MNEKAIFILQAEVDRLRDALEGQEGEEREQTQADIDDIESSIKVLGQIHKRG